MNTVPWIVVTLADLNDYLVGAQVAAINTAALSSGQTDRFTKTLQDVSNRVRTKVQSKLGSRISATPYAVPPEMKWIVAMLVIESLTAAIPGLKLDDDQRTRIEDAKRDMNRVADGRDQVTAPDDPQEPTIQANLLATVVTPNTALRQVTKSTMAGI